MTSIQSLISDAITEVEEWIEDHPDASEDVRDQAIDEFVRGQVPSMTTTLFQLVVDDNALAFEDIDTETETTPFAALAEAVALRIGRGVAAALVDDDDEDDD